MKGWLRAQASLGAWCARLGIAWACANEATFDRTKVLPTAKASVV